MLVLWDKWLPRPTKFSFIDPPFIPEEIKVTELKWRYGDWDEELICNMFGIEDAEAILSILGSGAGMNDVLRWHYKKDGEYSVKSGYKVAIGLGLEASSSFHSVMTSW